MRLVDSWKQSLSFFERKNLSMFGLVTLKAIKTTYSQIATYLLAPICILFLFDMMGSYKRMHVAHIALIIFIYLTVRSSVQRKDWRYYGQYLVHGLYILGWLALIFVVLHRIGYWWWALISMFAAYAIFFFLDSRPGIANFLAAQMQAAKMIIYNAPVCFIVGGCLALAWWFYMLVVQLCCLVIPLPIADMSVLLMPIEACVWSNLYIKWYHEQYMIYFDKP